VIQTDSKRDVRNSGNYIELKTIKRSIIKVARQNMTFDKIT